MKKGIITLSQAQIEFAIINRSIDKSISRH